MKPLLVVDAYLDPAGGAHNYLARFGERPAEVAAVAHGPCPRAASDYSAIFVTGSGASVCEPTAWVESAAALLRDAATHRVPVLGICFGHQLLPWALFGADRVRRTATPELGWVEIERTSEHALLEGYGARFTAFESHRDEVVAVGDELEVFAENADCAVQAFQVRGLPHYGVQFHPEMGLPEIEALIAERTSEAAGAAFDAASLLSGKRDTSELGDRIVANFLSLADVE
ncbi:MAG: type 1 glutamine amidotransferase [Planctomycetota bacterium]|jgi:GMP synthase (glutamine-hydrolysing)